MHFIVLAGSTRPKSLNHHLALSVLNALKAKGQSAEEIELDDYEMPLYSGRFEQERGIPQTCLRLNDKLKTATGVFIASPEYNASVTPLLKNTIDWLTRIEPMGEMFRTRAFAIGGASPGGFGGYRGLLALRQILEVGIGAMVIPNMVSVPHADKILKEDGTIDDARVSSMRDTAVENLIKVATLYA